MFFFCKWEEFGCKTFLKEILHILLYLQACLKTVNNTFDNILINITLQERDLDKFNKANKLNYPFRADTYCKDLNLFSVVIEQA